jgi:hypothetical protein
MLLDENLGETSVGVRLFVRAWRGEAREAVEHRQDGRRVERASQRPLDVTSQALRLPPPFVHSPSV